MYKQLQMASKSQEDIKAKISVLEKKLRGRKKMNAAWNKQAELVFKTKQARKYYEALEKGHTDKLKEMSGNQSAWSKEK